MKRVVTRTGLNVGRIAVGGRPAIVGTDPREIMEDPEIAAVLIATRHDRHAPLAIEAARAGKHVLVEKPLGLSVRECDAVLDAAASAGVLVSVGFNRRFAPLALAARAALAPEPKTILYRVNAGPLPPDHWLRDPLEGGGRLLGEGVHFFDFVRWLVGADPLRVQAVALDRRDGADLDNVSATVTFPDGSVATVVYTSQGHAGFSKERVEVFAGGAAVVIDDFARLERHGGPGRVRDTRGRVDKGHAGLLADFHRAVTAGDPLGVTAADGYWATWCAEQARLSVRRGSTPVSAAGGG